MEQGLETLIHFMLTLRVYAIQRGFASSVSKAFDAVDQETMLALRRSKDIHEVRQILDSPLVEWQDSAHCFRHNRECRFRVNSDIDTRWANLLATFFFGKISLSIKSKTHPQVVCKYDVCWFRSEDIAGVSCRDDSLMGAKKQDAGPGRQSALTHWRLGAQHYTILSQ